MKKHLAALIAAALCAPSAFAQTSPNLRQGQVLTRGFGTGLGMGLSNVHHRLQSLFGPASGLHIESTPGHGTRVSFWLPRDAGQAGAA